MEAYRSGHNGLDSKSSSPQGLVGSNPTASATVAFAVSVQIAKAIFLRGRALNKKISKSS